LEKLTNVLVSFPLKGLDKNEKPPPPPPAPTPQKPSDDEKLQAVIITVEGLYASQVLSLIPQKDLIWLDMKLLCFITS